MKTPANDDALVVPGSERDHRLAVSEVFLSFQGEGPSTGERAVFLRLAGCNLTCAWCDTAYSWDWTRYDAREQVRMATTDDIATELSDLAGTSTRLLVLTGGEPLLQRRNAIDFLQALARLRPSLRCEVETNGTVAPNEELTALVHRYVVSPKLEHSRVALRARLRHSVLKAFSEHERSVLKVVVSGPGDLPDATELARTAGFEPHRVWIMPQARDPQRTLELSRDLARPVLHAGFHLTTRTHMLLWGDLRGR